MKTLGAALWTSLAVAAIVAMGSSALALAAKGSRVDGYVKKDGTYVAPHYRSTPDGTKLNNYSSKGNSNPYTGKEGPVDPYKVTPANPYGNPSNPVRGQFKPYGK